MWSVAKSWLTVAVKEAFSVESMRQVLFFAENNGCGMVEVCEGTFSRMKSVSLS
jgi:hypothetical protein